MWKITVLMDRVLSLNFFLEAWDIYATWRLINRTALSPAAYLSPGIIGFFISWTYRWSMDSPRHEPAYTKKSLSIERRQSAWLFTEKKRPRKTRKTRKPFSSGSEEDKSSMYNKYLPVAPSFFILLGHSADNSALCCHDHRHGHSHSHSPDARTELCHYTEKQIVYLN